MIVRYGINAAYWPNMPPGFYNGSMDDATAWDVAQGHYRSVEWAAVQGDKIADQRLTTQLLDAAGNQGIEGATSDTQPQAALGNDAGVYFGSGNASVGRSLCRVQGDELQLSNGNNLASQLNLEDPNGNFAQIRPASLSGTTTFTLPNAGGTAALTAQPPLSGSVAGSTAALAANTYDDTVTVTVADATTSRVATASPEAALPQSGLVTQAVVTASRQVSVEYCNVAASSITPAAATIAVRVGQ